MTYIYDVTLNFNEILYDFFEWNSSDTLLHIRKIPMFRLDDNDFINIMMYEIVLDDEIYNKIKNKTEIYGKKSKYITSCLVRNDNNIIALKFDEKGKSVKISSIIIEEELDILEIKSSKYKNFIYKTLNKRLYQTSTRYEKLNRNYLENQLNSLNINKDSEKIKYLYFEYFGKFINDESEALLRLKKEINNSNISDNLKYFFKLSSNKN